MSVFYLLFSSESVYAKTMIKKLILLGFGLVLLIGLPLAIFVLQNQTTTQSGAAPVTKFSFNGPSSASAGGTLDENLVVDPGGTNQVSFVKFTFTYDPAFLDKAATPVTIDTTKYTILEQPTVNCTTLCTVTGTISVGTNQNAIIKSTTSIAVVHLIAKANTDASGTQLLFVSGQNQALSTGASDQAAENVFLSGTPKTITIGVSPTNGTNPTDTPTPGDTGAPTDTIAPTDSGGGGGASGGGGGTGGTGGAVVSCTNFTADVASGNSPLTVTFTTVGTSATDTISQIALTYGDGATDTVASGSGIGTGDINNQISHTYSSNGIFTANATLTTAGGSTSDPTTCKQTITVGAIASPTPVQKLPPTGPGETLMLVGIMGILMTFAGFAVLAGI